MTRLRKLAAQAFLALAAAASIGTTARAEEAPTVISPLQVAADQNNVNLHDGRTRIDGPSLGVPGAPNLRFDGVPNASPYINARITSPAANEQDQRSYAVHIGAASSDSFDCLMGECVSATGTGATFDQNQRIYRQAGSGAEWKFSQLAVSAPGPGSTTNYTYYASQVAYPNGETITFDYDTATPGLPFNQRLFRPKTLTSNLGYRIDILYASTDASSPDWLRVTQATLATTAAPNVPLQRLSYGSGGTIVDHGDRAASDPAGRTFTCNGCGGNEAWTGSLQLPDETAAALQVTQVSGFPVVAAVTRDGVPWTYSYGNLRLQSGTGRSIFDDITVTGPNGFTQVYQVANNYAAGRHHTTITRSTDPLGRQTNYYYDASDRPIRMVLPEGNEVQVAYDGNGNIVSRLTRAKPGSGQADVTETAFYPLGDCTSVLCYRPVWTRDGLGRQTDYVYNAAGQLTQRTEPADASGVQRRTIITYETAADATGALVLSRPAAVVVCGVWVNGTTCGTNQEIRTEYQYRPGTYLVTLERRRDLANGTSLETVMTYDNAGRPTSTDGPLSGSDEATYIRYDVYGRKQWEIGPRSLTTTRLARRYEYRAADDRVLYVETGTILDPAVPSHTLILSRTDFAYDSHRNPRQETVTAGGAIRSLVQRRFDDRGRLECESGRMNPAIFATLAAQNPPLDACTLGTQGTGANAFGPDRITRNTYDAASQLTQVQRAYGVTTANGFPATLQQNYATYTYSANGQRTSVTDANGNKAELRYDGYDRQVRWVFPSTTTPGQVNEGDYEAYTYDAVGNRLTLRKRDGSVLSYSYDNLNRLLVKTVPERAGLDATHTRDVYYGYDLRNLPLYARFDSASGEGVTNTYDAYGRQLTSSINMNGVTRQLSYGYDPGGRRTRITHPDGNYLAYEYDAVSHVTAIRENGVLYALSFGYDHTERPIAESTGWGWTSWSWDASSRLATIHIDLGGTASDQDFTFAYNPASQIAQRTSSNDTYASNTAYNVNRSYSVNGLNQYTAASGAAFTYDANGNLIGDGTNTYTYDVENRLVTRSGGVTLRYDPLGRLYEVAATSGTTRFLWDGDALVAEYNTSGTMLRRYAHGGGTGDDPLMWYEGATLGSGRSLFANHQGSIVAVSEVNGATVVINGYDAWGIPNATNQGRFQYTGQIWLPEIGIYYYKARMYSPTLGRFLQTDPIGYEDQVNLYAYVANDPVNSTDPSGMAQNEIRGNTCGRTGGTTCPGGVEGVANESAAQSRREPSRNLLMPLPHGDCDTRTQCDYARDEAATLAGRMSPEEFRDRMYWRGLGGIIGASPYLTVELAAMIRLAGSGTASRMVLDERWGALSARFGNRYLRGLFERSGAGRWNQGSLRIGWSYNARTGMLTFQGRIGKFHIPSPITIRVPDFLR